MYHHPHIALPPSEPIFPRRSTQESRVEVHAAQATEADLVRRAVAGERSAGAELCRRHQESLFRLLVHLVGHRQDAEDLTQETLVRALRSLHTFRLEACLSTWLRRIAVHLVHDLHRKRGRRARLVPLTEAADTPDPGESSSASLQRRELQEQLRLLVLRLPTHLRIPLVLRLEEKRSYADIAEVTGVKPETCRTQIMKARDELKRELDASGRTDA